MIDDHDLLRDYAGQRSEEAFRTLVERHVGLVHAAARRLVGDAHLAEEVTQAVFILLARKAADLKRGTVVAGWLYRTTRFVALQAMRAERRRQQHHERFAQMETLSEIESTWEQISPHLEEAINQLAGLDRDAVVLRFLQSKNFAEVAQSLGTSEAAAKMRVSRALEKLRVIFARRGVTIPGAMLLAALMAHGAQAAPLGLSATVAAAALSSSAATGSALSLVKGTLILMAWNKIKTTAIAALFAVLLGGGAVIVWNSAYTKPKAAAGTKPVVLALETFEPMQGEWEGVFELRMNDQPVTRSTALLRIRTPDNGRVCEIEMQVSNPNGRAPLIYNFSHSIMEGGSKLFTVSDAKTGRGNGEGTVTDSYHDRSKNEWRAAMRFPFANDRGVMEGTWHRRGDELHITSHDEFKTPDESNHVFADLRLRRVASAAASAATR